MSDRMLFGVSKFQCFSYLRPVWLLIKIKLHPLLFVFTIKLGVFVSISLMNQKKNVIQLENK